MEQPITYYYSGEPEDIKKVYASLEGIKRPGQFINLSSSQMWRTDKEKLLNACTVFILFMRREFNNNNYWLSMDGAVFFYEEVILTANE